MKPVFARVTAYPKPTLVLGRLAQAPRFAPTGPAVVQAMLGTDQRRVPRRKLPSGSVRAAKMVAVLTPVENAADRRPALLAGHALGHPRALDGVQHVAPPALLV